MTHDDRSTTVPDWLPAWFTPPLRLDLPSGHHLRRLRATDEIEPPVIGVRYVVLDDEERDVLGLVDVTPSADPAYDSVVSWRTTHPSAGAELHRTLGTSVDGWIAQDWPLERPLLTRQ